mmetsp:Transcript_14957/g.35008  ORF Transcript_14957/g.35008 Transcript_14957/m.35008 type:complete len:236 (+) Transcript_14957:1277-1984(+)
MDKLHCQDAADREGAPQQHSAPEDGTHCSVHAFDQQGQLWELHNHLHASCQAHEAEDPKWCHACDGVVSGEAVHLTADIRGDDDEVHDIDEFMEEGASPDIEPQEQLYRKDRHQRDVHTSHPVRRTTAVHGGVRLHHHNHKVQENEHAHGPLCGRRLQNMQAQLPESAPLASVTNLRSDHAAHLGRAVLWGVLLVELLKVAPCLLEIGLRKIRVLGPSIHQRACNASQARRRLGQ